MVISKNEGDHIADLKETFANLREARLKLNLKSVSSVARGCYEPLCDTLLQPLTLTACYRTMVIQCPMEVVGHQVEDAYNLNVAFAGLRELLDL